MTQMQPTKCDNFNLGTLFILKDFFFPFNLSHSILFLSTDIFPLHDHSQNLFVLQFWGPSLHIRSFEQALT